MLVFLSERLSLNSRGTVFPIVRQILSYLYSAGFVNADFSGMVLTPAYQNMHFRPYITASDEDKLYHSASVRSVSHWSGRNTGKKVNAMADPVFRSKLRVDMETFIIQKQAAGYPYFTSAKILSYFDTMIAENYPDSGELSKDICNAWINKCSNLHPNTLLRRVTPVRQFGKYLAGTGKPAYIIPGGVPHKQVHYDAHIFTEVELKAFFSSIDQCRKSPFSPYRCYVVPVIFRLLFTCGLRSSEARMLSVADIDLLTGKIYIRKSKGWEARIIYVSADMLDLLRRYDSIISQYLPGREAFFPNHRGDYYSKTALDVWFHEFWDALSEASITKGNTPRVHDFRHSYCVYRLNQWGMEKANLNALYPYLSEFVGHSNFADTDYYLTLAEPFYPEFESRMRAVNNAILPEVPHAD